MKTAKPVASRLISLLFLLFPLPGLAHTGLGEILGFTTGFLHPIGGSDHVLAMVAVGLWAVQMGGKAVWLVPLAFVSVMNVGGILGMLDIPVPYVEEGIALSVLVLGLLISSGLKFSSPVSTLMVGCFALFHGHAHGMEMPLASNGLAYGFGFALATALLHLAGIGIGLVFERTRRLYLTRIAGGVIAIGGILIAIS